MRFATMALLGLFAVAGPADAGNLTRDNVDKAGSVIDAAVAAYGGEQRLNALKSMVVTSQQVAASPGQSRRPTPPWDRNESESRAAIDFENEIFVSRNLGEGGGFEFDNGNIMNGENSFQLDYRRGTAAPLAEPDFDTTAGPFIRVTPVLLVKQLMEHGDRSHWLGETKVEGRPHDVVTLIMRVGPALSLYFDRETHLLSYSERVLQPFGLVEYHFKDYETVDGIVTNQRFVLTLNGDPNLERDVLSTRFDQDVVAMASVPKGLARVAAVAPDELALQELADGVYFVGGTGTYAMFVEMSDHIVAVGGTAGIPERIAELRKKVADKPIRYAVMTHHHNDHVLGMPAYVEEGATVLAVKQHEEVLRNAAGDAGEPEFEFVAGSRTLSDGNRRIEIHDIGPTPHSEHLLVAFLPTEGILFEADHMGVPRTGPMPPAVPNTVVLAKAIEVRELAVRTIVGAHSPRVVSEADLRASLAAAEQTPMAAQ